MLTNHKPHLDVDDSALKARVLLVPFLESFDDRRPVEGHNHAPIKNLSELLHAEAPGILAWLVRGAIEYQAEGLKPPRVVMDATEQYLLGEDDLQRFLDERTESVHGAKIKASELYKEFETWTNAEGVFLTNQKDFGSRLGRLYLKTKTKHGVFYEGIRIVDELQGLNG